VFVRFKEWLRCYRQNVWRPNLRICGFCKSGTRFIAVANGTRIQQHLLLGVEVVVCEARIAIKLIEWYPFWPTSNWDTPCLVKVVEPPYGKSPIANGEYSPECDGQRPTWPICLIMYSFFRMYSGRIWYWTMSNCFITKPLRMGRSRNILFPSFPV
jgi:hypothetical protein